MNGLVFSRDKILSFFYRVLNDHLMKEFNFTTPDGWKIRVRVSAQKDETLDDLFHFSSTPIKAQDDKVLSFQDVRETMESSVICDACHKRFDCLLLEGEECPIIARFKKGGAQ